jgi:hypothetical protein
MLSWVKEYSELIERFERKQNPEIKGRMDVDEVFVEVRGRRCCIVHTVDSRTGYCPEAVLSERRDLEAYDGFFARLKKRLGGQIRGVFEREREKPPEKRKLVTFVSDTYADSSLPSRPPLFFYPTLLYLFLGRRTHTPIRGRCPIMVLRSRGPQSSGRGLKPQSLTRGAPAPL